jgi:hypothetical protein
MYMKKSGQVVLQLGSKQSLGARRSFCALLTTEFGKA